MIRRTVLCACLPLLAAALVHAGCGGGDGLGSGSSSLTCEVDGTPMESTGQTSGVDSAGNTYVLGSGDDWSVQIDFLGKAAGDFSSDSSAGAQITYTDANHNSFWASDVLEGSSYAINITSYDTKGIEGTYTATVVGPDGATHTISGSFQIVFTGVNMSNPYEGTYMGIFRVKGQVLEGYMEEPPYDPIWGPLQVASFRITIELDFLASAEGTAAYLIPHANVSDPMFNCMVAGCEPKAYESTAALPDPPGTPTPSGDSQNGHGIALSFANGSRIVTSNTAGELYTSTDARTLSNALGLDEPWGALDSQGTSFVKARLGEHFSSLKEDTREMTWAMTKSAL